MLGVVAGDVVGSIYEGNPTQKNGLPLFHPLCRFTDDTVLTVATAHAIVPEYIAREVRVVLTRDLLQIVDDFEARYRFTQ